MENCPVCQLWRRAWSRTMWTRSWLLALPPFQAWRAATADIPVIAIDLESDPVASGWIESLARPGGNVTGVFLDFPTFSAKCLQLLIEACPALAGIGVLWDPTTGPLQLGP